MTIYDILFYTWVIILMCILFKPNTKRTKKPKAKKRQTPSLRTKIAKAKRELLVCMREYKVNEHNYQTNRMNPKMEKRNK